MPMRPRKGGAGGSGVREAGNLWEPHTRRLKLYLNFWKQSTYCACVLPMGDGDGEEAVGHRLSPRHHPSPPPGPRHSPPGPVFFFFPCFFVFFALPLAWALLSGCTNTSMSLRMRFSTSWTQRAWASGGRSGPPGTPSLPLPLSQPPRPPPPQPKACLGHPGAWFLGGRVGVPLRQARELGRPRQSAVTSSLIGSSGVGGRLGGGRAKALGSRTLECRDGGHGDGGMPTT